MVLQLLLITYVLLITTSAEAASDERSLEYDVVIAGGSTAALAAAFSAAEEGAKVALLEPTDWIGGQLTASGVSAVDEAWHKITAPGSERVLLDVAAAARDPQNMTPFFRDALQALGNPGAGWVSRYCFEPLHLLEQHLEPHEQELHDRLSVFRETVVKQVVVSDRRIEKIIAIKRTPREGVGGYDRLLSEDLPDWYSAQDSQRFTKKTLVFTGKVFVDATEWGELLALSGAPMLQGIEEAEGPSIGDDIRGQATVFCFAQQMHSQPVEKPFEFEGVAGLGFGRYAEQPDAWQRIWTYRRLRGSGQDASPGEITLQNWGYSLEANEGGNDYPHGYLFLSIAEMAAQRDNWLGGINTEVLAAAERRAFAWHDWFRRNAPAGISPDQIAIAPGVMGTDHGLAKMPYIRDTRRSIGLNRYVFTSKDFAESRIDEQNEIRTGSVFSDRVALGAYPIDIHPLAGGLSNVDERDRPTLPYYIPLRALTNDGYDNLIVAGKTMAQTFLANAATRTHPVEWSSGAAAGVFAAYLVERRITTRDACDQFVNIQSRVVRHTPIEWSLPRETSSN